MREFRADKIPLPPQDQLRWSDLDSNLPVDIEIGAGQGLHAVTYARQNPDRQLIALERTTRALKMMRLKSDFQGLENLYVLRTDAINWITHFVPSGAVDRIFLLYPNPYPKKRQNNLRWHNMPFMGFLKSRLKSGGQFILATNKYDYQREAHETLVHIWQFKLRSSTLLAADATTARTHFERKYLARGEPCWNMIFELPQSGA